MTTTTNQGRQQAPASLPELDDRLAITDLVFRLGVCLDEHRTADLHHLFTEDATATTPGGTASGRGAVVAQATRTHETGKRFQHQMTNVLVDLNGDRAAVRANLLAAFVHDTGSLEFLLGAVYRFQAERTLLGWRLATLEVEPVWRSSPA